MKIPHHHSVLALFLSGMVLSACAAGPEDQASQPAPDTSQASEATAGSPTDPEVMYRVWSGEYQGAEGDMEKAAIEYLAAALESDDPEVAKRATSVAMAAQSLQLAAMASDRWVLLDPNSVEAREVAIQALVSGGDYVGAEHQLSGLLELTSDDPWQGWQRVSALLAPSSNAERTLAIVDHLVEVHEVSDNPYVFLVKSQAIARQGDFQLAISLADEAIKLAPDAAGLHAWAGRLALSTRNETAALEHYRRAWQLNPENRMNAMVYAEFLRQTGSINEANQVLASLPDTPEVRFTRIGFAMDSGSIELADSLFEGFYSVEYEDSIEHSFQAARSAELLRRWDAAIKWYEKLEGTERELLALLRRSVLMAQQGDLEGARQLLTSARETSIGPARLEMFSAEAQILLEAEQEQEALALLNEALRQYPDDTRLRYTRSLVAVGLGDLELAEADLRHVISLDPDNPAALNALGYTLADLTDRVDEAEILVRRAYEMQPDEASIIDSMGWVAYRQGRLEEAANYLRRAYSIDRNAEIAAHLGEVLWKQGKFADAKAILTQGREVEPGNKVLQDTLERLDVDL